MNNVIIIDKRTETRAEVINVTAVVGLLLLLCLAMPIVTQQFLAGTWYAQNNQFIIGPMVNAALIYSALRFRKTYNTVGIVLLPSVCTALLGLIGIQAIFLMYMIPFIWVGNMALVLSFRLMFNKQTGFTSQNRSAQHAYTTTRYTIAAILGVLLKVGCIFGGFLLMNSLGVFPTPVAANLWTMMGIVQLITATAGAIIVYGAIRAFRLKNRSQQTPA